MYSLFQLDSRSKVAFYICVQKTVIGYVKIQSMKCLNANCFGSRISLKWKCKIEFWARESNCSLQQEQKRSTKQFAI